MKTTFFLPIFLTCATLSATNSNMLESQGHEWYERRAEGAVGAQAHPEPISKAIALFEKSVEMSPSESNVISLLRSYYFKGSFVPMSNEEQKAIFSKGKNLGENMLKKFSRSAGVRYWLAAHWGKWAKTYGAIAAAREGAADRIKELSESVIQLDPSYNEAGGFEILGLVHFYSPRIPFLLSWPSSQTALENLRKAAQEAPSIANNLCYAQALLKDGKKDAALGLLKKTVAMQPRAERMVEDRNGLVQAMELLKKNL